MFLKQRCGFLTPKGFRYKDELVCVPRGKKETLAGLVSKECTDSNSHLSFRLTLTHLSWCYSQFLRL